MAVDQNNSSSVKLWIIFGLFIGLIVGLIVYEVRQYVLAKEQRENFESIRKMQSNQMNKAYKENFENEKIRGEETANETMPNDSL